MIVIKISDPLVVIGKPIKFSRFPRKWWTDPWQFRALLMDVADWRAGVAVSFMRLPRFSWGVVPRGGLKLLSRERRQC